MFLCFILWKAFWSSDENCSVIPRYKSVQKKDTAYGGSMVFETMSEKETFELGKRLGQDAKPGEIICLDGDLGVGKTVFTQGFAEGLQIEESVNSPTFTIVQVYDEGRIPLYHFDVYRIGDPEEMYEIGYEEYFFGEGVCLI